jgi:hypothetical protein
LEDPDAIRGSERAQRQQQVAEARDRRGMELSSLSRRVSDLSNPSSNAQARGYELERVLADLFAAFEMTFAIGHVIPNPAA